MQVVSALVEEIVAETAELGMTAMPEACWRCDVCNKKFITRKVLSDHKRKLHTNPGKCDVCSKNFSSAVKLNNHMQRRHTDGNTLLCSTCGHQSSHPDNLRRHMMTHSREVVKTPRKKKSYPCVVCNKVYGHKRTLQKHVKQKHEERQEEDGDQEQELHEQQNFSCSICDKTFRLKTSLSSHKSREHQGGEVRCLACDKAFNRPADLRRHMASHSAAAPAGLKPMAELSRSSQDRRMRNIAAKFSSELESFSPSDRRKIFRKLVQNNPEVLEKYSENPLTEEDILEMVHNANLSDRQLLKVLAVIRRKWGRKCITPNIRDKLKEKKELLSHLFDKKWIDKDAPIHFEDKKGQPASRFVPSINRLIVE
jgi:hypothetical protein